MQIIKKQTSKAFITIWKLTAIIYFKGLKLFFIMPDHNHDMYNSYNTCNVNIIQHLSSQYLPTAIQIQQQALSAISLSRQCFLGNNEFFQQQEVLV